MKKFIPILALAITFISCSKSIDANQPGISSAPAGVSPLEKKFLVNGRDSVLLQIFMTPTLFCYSPDNGQITKPCDIFIRLACTLSQPVDGYVKVDVRKTNIVELTDPKSAVTEMEEKGVTFNIIPNTTSFTFISTLRNNDLVAVPEHKFKIDTVSVFKFKD